jgi:hypothetical protein
VVKQEVGLTSVEKATLDRLERSTDMLERNLRGGAAARLR